MRVVMNLWVSKIRGITSLAEEMLACEQGLCTMEMVHGGKGRKRNGPRESVTGL